VTAAGPPETAIARRALIPVCGGLFCGYVGLTAVIPVLPGFVRQQYGAADLAVGLVVTVTGLTALVTRPLAGALADRYGYRRIMQAGALIVAAGGALYLRPAGLPGLIAVRLLLGIGEASLFTAGAVWIVSLAPYHRRGQLIGLYGVSMWGGISAGTFAGAVLVHYGYTAVWGFSAAVPFLGLVLISSVPARVGASQAPAGAGQAAPLRGLRHRLLLRPALVPGLGLALAAAGYAGLASFVVLYLKARGIGSGVAVLGTFSAVYAGTRLFIGHLPDQLGPRRVAAWSGLGEAAGLLIIAAAPDLPVAVAGSVIMGAGFSLLHPSLALMVMNRTDRSRQGAAIGAYTSFWDLGLAVFGPVTGAVAAGFGYAAVFVFGAVCAAGATAVALSVRSPAATPAAAG
jgi:MFS family permease